MSSDEENGIKSRQHDGESALSLSHGDVGHSERGEDDWVLVRVGVGGGDKFMRGCLRVSQGRGGGVSQDDVLRR